MGEDADPGRPSGLGRLSPADWLTATRLVLIPVLWTLALAGMRTPFAVGLALAGLTDALDGPFARRRHEASEAGARFDSLADNLLGLSALFWLWIFLKAFILQHLAAIAVAVILNFVSLIYGFLKYRQVLSYHLVTNKLAGVVMFLFILHALLTEPSPALLYLMLGVNALSSIEEMILTTRHDRMRTDKLSAFV